jgi:ribonucleoside-triphosphate reductase
VDGEVTEYAKEKAHNIADYIENLDLDHDMGIEEIQDLVEKGLMSCKRKDVAKSYILYRENRTRIRNQKSALMNTIKEKLDASNVVNQNANVDEHSFGGRRGEATNEMMKQYALDNCMSEMARNNHLNNEIYIHDLDSYAIGMHNCLTIPFDKLLAEGFNTRQTDVRPAASINTAFQLVAVIFQLQSLQQFGGVSASHLDWTMVPYVRKSFYKHFKDGVTWICDIADTVFDHINSELPIDSEEYPRCRSYEYAMAMTQRELDQAVEGMYHNLNTLQSRSGNQLPFTSINYGTCTLSEGRMVTKALLEGSLKGNGKLHKTPIFPCGIFQCMKGVNRKPGDPNYDLFQLALKSTAKRLYPNYANVDWSTNAGFDPADPKTYVSTMGCRTYNGSDINAEPGTNPQTKDGRGNIAPVTIILPTLAMEARELSGDTCDNFLMLLDKKLFEARDMLKERYEWICSQDPSSAQFMYENGTMLGYKPEEGIRSAMKHGTLVIGQLGLAETLQILLGCDHTKKEGMEFAKIIEALFKKRCAQFKQEEHLNFGVYYTPAENLCYTAMKNFRKKYGIIPNVSDREYFTNSIHVPVWIKMDPFTKIDIESQLTGYSNAGCITYVELEGSASQNLEALEQLVNYAMDKDIPYFALNVPCDTCLECGYTGEFNDECPVCHSKNIQQLRRVTGYLTGNYKTAFNWGKQKEVEDRVKHTEQLSDWRR